MKLRYVSILSGICIVTAMVIFTLYSSAKIQDTTASETTQIQNETSVNTTHSIPSLRCSISCALQLSEPSNDTLLIAVPIEDSTNDAIWVDSHSKSSFYGCTLSQYENGYQNILKKYTEIPPGWSDRVSPINFTDGEKFVLECSTPPQTATVTIPKCLSPSELQALYPFHIMFPTYVPSGYEFQCGIGTYNDIAYYTYWNNNWQNDPLYSKNLLNMRMELEGAKKGVIGIQVMNGSNCGNNSISANDTSTLSYGDFCSNGTRYHLYGMLGTKNDLLKMEQSMR